ncbi:MAG: serine hydrolase [Snowella sp.]|nr:serine hydrolase [Snowella sp.]
MSKDLDSPPNKRRKRIKLAPKFWRNISYTVTAIALSINFILLARILNNKFFSKDTADISNTSQPHGFSKVPDNESSVSGTLPDPTTSPQLPQLNTLNQPPKTALKNTPDLVQEQEKLDNIRNSIIETCAKRGYSTANLSLMIIDVNSGASSGYQEQQLRYPASIAKIFWLTYASALITQSPQLLSNENPQFLEYLTLMIRESDNNSTSNVIDIITQTKSGATLSPAEYATWSNKRNLMNQFFEHYYGFKGINISQKVFPIPDIDYSSPEGRDQQIRGNNPDTPIRNKLSVQHAAYLMYFIAQENFLSPQLKELLKWDLNSFDWKSTSIDYFNPIKSFFGESLPQDTIFYSKAGWTTQTRSEVAYISTPDGKTKYVLAIFTEDTNYAKDETLFPEISKITFNTMQQSRLKK